MTTVDFSDRSWFSSDGFDGYGSIEVFRHAGTNCLALRPQPSARTNETHAALMTSARSYADFDATFHDVVTIEQLRTSGDPSPWERAWLIWHLVSLRQFYYFILKSNGWELGKVDPAYPGGQRFLVTGETPRFPVGQIHSVRIRQNGNAIMAYVDGALITSFLDEGDASVPGSADAYTVGRFGFYCEDAHVRFGGFSVLEEH
jgi:hypothetical protein